MIWDKDIFVGERERIASWLSLSCSRSIDIIMTIGSRVCLGLIDIGIIGIGSIGNRSTGIGIGIICFIRTGIICIACTIGIGTII